MKIGLLLIDIQNDYFPDGRMVLSGADAAGRNAGRLLSYFREQNRFIYHIQHLARGPGAAFFIEGTEGAEIHECVRPLSGERVIQKHFPNSFRETVLLETLKKDGIEQLVICGAMSHMCVDATTRAAADLDFSCIVIHDACATRNLEFLSRTIPADQVHGAFMSALGAAYAQVLSCHDFMNKAG